VPKLTLPTNPVRPKTVQEIDALDDRLSAYEEEVRACVCVCVAMGRADTDAWCGVLS
jgi:hypothetical protein